VRRRLRERAGGGSGSDPISNNGDGQI